MPALPRPDGHHTITPGFMIGGAADLIGFVESAFGGRVVDRYDGPGGAVMHVEVMIGDSVIMFGEPMPDCEPMPASLSYYVDDAAAVDETYRKALDAGATSITEPADQFYGYRSACVSDPSGNRWTICAVIEQLTRAQIDERLKAMPSIS